jgi:DNA-binding NarL/FixJ family response regulator
MTATDRLPIVVVQQHSVLREALQMRLEAEVDFHVVAGVGTIAEAADALATHPGAVVLVDEPTAPEACRTFMNELRALSPFARAVMLVNGRHLTMVSAAVNAGVVGVLCSDTPTTCELCCESFCNDCRLVRAPRRCLRSRGVLRNLGKRQGFYLSAGVSRLGDLLSASLGRVTASVSTRVRVPRASC